MQTIRRPATKSTSMSTFRREFLSNNLSRFRLNAICMCRKERPRIIYSIHWITFPLTSQQLTALLIELTSRRSSVAGGRDESIVWRWLRLINSISHRDEGGNLINRNFNCAGSMSCAKRMNHSNLIFSLSVFHLSFRRRSRSPQNGQLHQRHLLLGEERRRLRVSHRLNIQEHHR